MEPTYNKGMESKIEEKDESNYESSEDIKNEIPLENPKKDPTEHSNSDNNIINKEESIVIDGIQLHVTIMKGQKFVDYDNTKEISFIWDVSFMEQRIITKPIQSSTNPEFMESFRFKLQSIDEKTG